MAWLFSPKAKRKKGEDVFDTSSRRLTNLLLVLHIIEDGEVHFEIFMLTFWESEMSNVRNVRDDL